jgi:hypothetical protein
MAPGAEVPEGPVCRATPTTRTRVSVHVLSLSELAPERAARIRERLAHRTEKSAVVAIPPGSRQVSPDFAARLAILAEHQNEVFSRLQSTEPTLLSNGLYRLDVGDAFLTPLVATSAPDGRASVRHAAAAPSEPVEARP